MFKLLTGVVVLCVIAGVKSCGPDVGFSEDFRRRLDHMSLGDVYHQDNRVKTDYEDKINALSQRNADRQERESQGRSPPRKSLALQQEVKQKRVRVLVDFSNQELMDISRACVRVSAVRSSLFSVMVTWDMAWPVFKTTWDRCIDRAIVDYPQAARLKKMRKSDFEVKIDYIGREH